MTRYLKYLSTFMIVLIAVVVVLLKYQDYLSNPWTRNGRKYSQTLAENTK